MRVPNKMRKITDPLVKETCLMKIASKVGQKGGLKRKTLERNPKPKEVETSKQYIQELNNLFNLLPVSIQFSIHSYINSKIDE